MEVDIKPYLKYQKPNRATVFNLAVLDLIDKIFCDVEIDKIKTTYEGIRQVSEEIIEGTHAVNISIQEYDTIDDKNIRIDIKRRR